MKLRSLVLVAMQVLLSAAVVLATSSPLAHMLALTVALSGMLLGVWAFVAIGARHVSVMPELHADAQLVTSGPYRWVRHPMYSALLLFIGGLASCPFEYWKCGAWSTLVFVLLIKLQVEEHELSETFPGYREYSRRTKRLIPFLY